MQQILISLFTVVFACTAYAQTQGGSTPSQAPAVAFIWQDLYGDVYTAGEDGLWLRSDLSVSTPHGDGVEIVAIKIDSQQNVVQEHTGSIFVEHTRYPAYWFPVQSSFISFDYNGSPLVVKVSCWIDVVSGRMINSTGTERIVASLVYVVDYEGIGAQSGAGVKVEHLLPFHRSTSLETADTRAFRMSAIDIYDGEQIDLPDCSQFDDYCEHQFCLCENEHQIAYEGAMDLCDGFNDVTLSVGTATACAGGSAVLGAKVGAKRGGFWGTILGTLVGGCAGAATGFFTVEAIEDAACRQTAETRRQIDLQFSRNELAKCRNSEPPSFTCRDTLQDLGP